MRSPTAVLISDVHYSLKTYHIADQAFRMAIDKAAELGVPLIDCGDLTNDKAILRGEVIKTIISTMLYAADKGVKVYCLVGNHSLWNEKGSEHSLHFLTPYAIIISQPTTVDGFNFIPYQTSCEGMLAALKLFPSGSMIFAHQGVQGAWMGDYVQDRTSLPKETFADYRILSGHYHRAASIKCGRPRKGAVGLFSYVGNPYSLSFSEASDGPKGFQVLYNDGILELVPTNLRKHVVIETTAEKALSGWVELPAAGINPGDIIHLKVTGTPSELGKINKQKLGEQLFNGANYRLDKIPTKADAVQPKAKKASGLDLLDQVIDTSVETVEEKKVLKELAREVMS
jgi:hypothetical protein